jgi:N-acetyl-1-D-myo-inositol-2-amino-2-deoxy-alpha-D-glucopyranoside deacetylase
MSDHRLLLVHAHPDDETIGSGATMAHYAAAGAHVTLVTCTLGEEGEVLVPDLVHLAADAQDRLGEHRIGELDAACAALGVSDHRFLGGPGRYRDSGMMGTPANDRAGNLWNADFAEATRLLVDIVREVRPQVVVTYDENGDYGHPDHIRAHQFLVAAVDAAADPAFEAAGEPWTVSKFYYTATPKSVIQAGIDHYLASGGEAFWGPEVTRAEDVPYGVADELVTTAVDGSAQFEKKMDALRAHATQISADGPFFALADGIGRQAFGVEYFRLVRGNLGPVGDDGREHDLFAGLD